MYVVIHTSDLQEFLELLSHYALGAAPQVVYSTTRWVRGMPEVSIFVEAAFTADGQLFRFSRHLGTIFPHTDEREKIDIEVRDYHDRITLAVRGFGLTILPGRVTLAAEHAGKGGAP